MAEIDHSKVLAWFAQKGWSLPRLSKLAQEKHGKNFMKLSATQIRELARDLLDTEKAQHGR